MSQVKTVKIKHGDDYQVINASDFNPNIHELCEGEKLDGAFKANLIPGEPADLNGLVPVEQFDAVVLDLTNTKEQLATAQGELIAFKNDVAAMQARITELQSIDYSKMKVDDLKETLKLKGIDYPVDAKKDDLLALLTPKE